MNTILAMGAAAIGATAISIILGILIGFFGYRLKKIAFTIIWFIFGFTLTCGAIDFFGVNAGNTFTTFILPAIGGLFFALIGYRIENLVIALTVALAVFTMLSQIIGLSNPLSWIICIVVAVIASCIAVRCVKPAIIIITGIYGAHLIISTLFQTALLSYNISFGGNLTLQLVLTVVLAACAIMFQFKNAKKVA